MTEKKQDTRRLFFALKPEPVLTDALCVARDSLCQRLRTEEHARPVPAANLHLTLLFLGNVPSHRINELQVAAQEVATLCDALDLRLNSSGCWPGPGILWLAPKPAPESLLLLASRLRERIQKLDIPLERRPYRPHVTLLRHKKRLSKPMPTDGWNIPALPVWQARSFVLMESRAPQPYTVVHSWPLRTP